MFPAEKPRSLEIGVKSRWFGGGLAADLALFSIWVADYQVYTFLDGQSITLSADSVRSQGLEARMAWRPVAGLDLSLGAAVTDAEITDFTLPDPLGSPQPLVLDGNQVPNAPRFHVNLGAGYGRALNAAWQIDGRLDLALTGRTDYTIDNVLYAPLFTRLDGRVAVTRDNLELALWGKNLTDARRAISAFGQTLLPLLQGLGPGGPFDTFTLNRGRQIGASLKYSF